MYNVDTLSLALNFREYIQTDEGKNIIDKAKVCPIDEKIRKKLCGDISFKKNGLPVFNAKGQYFGYFFYYNCEWNSLTVTLSHNKIEDYTCDEILSNVKSVVMSYFELAETEMVQIKLSRIDIKCDYLCKNDEMLIIKNTISKIKSNFRHYKKVVKIDNEQGYVVKYTSHICRNNFEYDVDRYTFKKFNVDKRFVINQKNMISNNIDEIEDDESEEDEEDGGTYIEIAFYDKGEETKFRVSVGKATNGELKKYTNIFRSEVRVKNGRLNSNVFQNKNLSKDLSTYYNETATAELYHKYIKSILGENDFYRIDIAITVINNSSYTASKKAKLVQFISEINRDGYSLAEKKFLAKRSKATWYSYIHAVENLGLNIITFDAVIDGKIMIQKKICNFGQLKNDVNSI